MSLLKTNEIQVFNGTTVTITAPAVVSANDNTNAALRITQTGTGNALVVEDSSPDSTPFVVNANGNVGIGGSPETVFDIASTAPVIQLRDTNGPTDENRYRIALDGSQNLVFQAINDAGSGGGAVWQFTRSANNIETLVSYRAATERIKLSNWDNKITFSNALGVLGTETLHDLQFLTNNTERMRIDSSGNVGIGTTSPSQKLDVTGNINATGTLTLGTALAVAEGGTGVASLGALDAADLGSGAATDGYVLTADGAGNAAWEAASGGGGGTTAYLEHSSTISDSFTVTSGTNRMYIGGTTFSGTITVAGRLAIVAGPANFTGTINITGTLAIMG